MSRCPSTYSSPLLITGFDPAVAGRGKGGPEAHLAGRTAPFRRPAAAGILGRLWSGCLAFLRAPGMGPRNTPLSPHAVRRVRSKSATQPALVVAGQQRPTPKPELKSRFIDDSKQPCIPGQFWVNFTPFVAKVHSHRPRRQLLAVIGGCKHYASMPHVLIRDVPEDVHAALQRRAERRHLSLQQYLAAELRHLAEQRSVSEVLDEVEAQHGGRVGLQAAVADLDDERSRR